ncbi:sigma-70 family RNA polymerase sigma factor [Achromobacter denitrificans]|jgi:RNA polymerase sigma factor (sigma-70 family)|uniref:Sigma-70 family RNA polymerase sigma factor n=2 Tax=Achromobacter denitrificans TaxID=32002 RepID=A0A6N0JHL3_ACHDE|nr:MULTISPECIES: sigma-70 family RNA polymerase sigma factor [Achromobacter]ASC66862.1 RNA polymerase ECF-subfamily sigma-70 factor [Achromobacter denitrificans]MBV2158096.1 sigma-70 family RNA polymerase sigma factor [Achromobacter denitrificans]MDX3882306.1 sigma-70 family RNA polymerase sigma factor [Achromobacter sp.]QCS65123.1 sigma-70 family RNA polymerase sigma factor [Achromobacter denitrificans]QKQ46621.1 sigma-70 family RNA polymerase sigma factor [Achromobacter denitrificans]
MSRSSSSRPGWLAYYDELVGAWSRRAGSRHDAEDAAHDAIEDLLKADDSVAKRARSYLFQATGHRLIDRWRRQARAEHIPLDELGENEQPALTDPESPVRAARLADDLARVLAELPPKCREAFVLNRIEGWTQAEVARHMGLSKNMIERYVMRAIQYARDRMHQHTP